MTVTDQRFTPAHDTLELTAQQIQRLADDAVLVASAAYVYVPVNRRKGKGRNIRAAAERILKLFEVIR